VSVQVILTEDVVGLGDIGQTVNVKPGYARNFLLPRGRAVAHHMRQIEAKKRRMKNGAEEMAQKIRDLTIVLDVRVASGGKVFGSITSRDIAEKLKESGFEVDRKRVLLPEPIKKVGTHFVRVKLHPEVEGLLKITVNEREASAEEEQTETDEAKRNLEQHAAGAEE
jgi:large subunit ribosomal protein L9